MLIAERAATANPGWKEHKAMWVVERGIVHTADVDWASVIAMSDVELVALRAASRASLHDALDLVEDGVFDYIGSSVLSAAEEAPFVEQAPPRLELKLAGQAIVAAALTKQLLQQPLRWRLDYVWAVRDCLRAERAAAMR
jgi:hypothetical protein